MKELARKAVRCPDLSHRGGLLEERGPNGELFARHVHGPSVDDIVLSELDGAVYYYHHDDLDCTVAVTDTAGTIVEQYRYDVYGQPYFFGPDGTPRTESALGLRFLFTGREWLGSVGLYDYRHRAYSPSLGRFLQIDPLAQREADRKRYAYARNAPLRFNDGFGTLPVCAAPVVIGIVKSAGAAVIGSSLAPLISYGIARVALRGSYAVTAPTVVPGVGEIPAVFYNESEYRSLHPLARMIVDLHEYEHTQYGSEFGAYICAEAEAEKLLQILPPDHPARGDIEKMLWLARTQLRIEYAEFNKKERRNLTWESPPIQPPGPPLVDAGENESRDKRAGRDVLLKEVAEQQG